MTSTYDAIIVGARVAGAPTAMLLARQGFRVLVVDRADFPSDVLSTHLVHAPALADLKRWGLWDRFLATCTPHLPSMRFDFGDLVVEGRIGSYAGADGAAVIRRHVLDPLLLEAAVEAGAEVRTGFTMSALILEEGRVAGIRGHDADGIEVEERARIVIGADGMRSRVAKSVGAEAYNELETISGVHYSYWEGIPDEGWRAYVRPGRVIGVQPTNAGRTSIFVQYPRSEFPEFKKDIDGNVMAAIDQVPELAAQVRAASRVEGWSGTGDLPGFFRKPYGPGWALVGDAGYHCDPTLGHGIMNAFFQAGILSEAVADGLSGRLPMDEALAAFHEQRDLRLLPDYELVSAMAHVEAPPPDEELALVAALADNRAAADQWVRMLSGIVPVAEFYAPENVAAILGAAPDVPLAA